MANIGKTTTQLPRAYNLDVEGRRSTWDKIYLGIVKDVADASLRRIKVWIPELCGNEEDQDVHWIFLDYASPSAGSGQGFVWTPSVKDNVLCGFINGDPNRGFYFAGIFPVNANETIPVGGQTRGSQVLGNPDKNDNSAPVVNQQSSNINIDSRKTPGTGGLGAKRSMTDSLTVNGIQTRAGHNIVMDDDVKDGYVRLQTRHGATVILQDITDTVLITTASGLARIELDTNGDIKIFGQNNISIAANGVLNLSGAAGVNIQAGEITDSGNTVGDLNIYSTGQSHIYSEGESHVKSNSSMLLTSMGEMHRYANGNIFDTAAGTGSIQQRANKDIRFTSYNNVETFAAQSIHTTAFLGTIDMLSGGDTRWESRGNINIRSAQDTRVANGGSFDLGVGGAIKISSGGDSSLSSGGNLLLQSKTHMDIVSGDYLRLRTSGDLTFGGGGNTRIKGNGDLELSCGSGSVKIGPRSIINATVFSPIPAPVAANSVKVDAPLPGPLVTADASKTRVALPPYPANSISDRAVIANPAMTADKPKLIAHTVLKIDGAAGGNRVVTVSYGVSSQGGLPGSEPDQSRSNCPGYSGTGSVMPTTDTVIKAFFDGQYKPDQTIPLQVLGRPATGGSDKVFAKYTGVKFVNNMPQYKLPPDDYDAAKYFTVAKLPGGTSDPTTGLRLKTSDTGVYSIQDHEGDLPPPARKGLVFGSVCDSNVKMIGYGHVLSQDEIKSGNIVINNGPTVPWNNDIGLTDDQKLLLLKQDLATLEAKIIPLLGSSLLTQDQWDSLIDFAFLIGFDGFKKSLIASYITNGQYDKVPTQMVQWVMACGNAIVPFIQLRQQQNAAKFAGEALGAYSGNGISSSNLRAKNGFTQVLLAAQSLGDKFPEVTAAQWALESGWGSAPSGKNNPFGQKAAKGQPGTDVVTHEVIGGQRVQIVAKFADYNTVQDAISYHVKRWSSLYAGASNDYQAVSILQKNGYATDPDYVGKIMSIINSNQVIISQAKSGTLTS